MSTKTIKAIQAKTPDAIALLTADHKVVKALFKDFEKLAKAEDNDEQKAGIVRKICDELTMHAQVEEEIFYPAVRDAIEDDDLIDKAEVEHATAKDLIAQLEQMHPTDDLYTAKVTVLSEYIEHHVNEEETDVFAKARNADLNTAALGEQMARRKEQLKAELGIMGDEPKAAPSINTGNGHKQVAKAIR